MATFVKKEQSLLIKRNLSKLSSSVELRNIMRVLIEINSY